MRFIRKWVRKFFVSKYKKSKDEDDVCVGDCPHVPECAAVHESKHYSKSVENAYG